MSETHPVKGRGHVTIFAMAATPMTTMTARSTRGDSCRPTLAPAYPPTIEPNAISAATDQSILPGNEHEDDGRNSVGHRGQHVLQRNNPLQPNGHQDAHDAHQQDPLRRAEVAACLLYT